jgi:ankyrin repeat protein
MQKICLDNGGHYSGRTPLYWAQLKKRTDCTRTILARGGDPFTALALAIDDKNQAMFTSLFDNMMQNITETNIDKTISKVVAMLKKKGDVTLLNNINVNNIIKHMTNKTANILAKLPGYQDITKKWCSTINFYTKFALVRDNKLPAIKFLSDYGAEHLNVEWDGITLLHEAFSKEMVGLLLDAKLDPNKVDYDKQTSLHKAVKEKNAEKVKLLLSDNRTNPEILDQEGKQAIDYAEEGGEIRTLIIGSQKQKTSKIALPEPRNTIKKVIDVSDAFLTNTTASFVVPSGKSLSRRV